MILWSNLLFYSVTHISYLDTHVADAVIPHSYEYPCCWWNICRIAVVFGCGVEYDWI